MNDILAAALEYLDLGFSVMPIRPGPEKKPYCAWKVFQSELPTEDQVYEWWDRWPKANVAIITGSISGIFVVDADGEIGARWVTENLPKTAVYTKTGRDSGCHCFYRLPAGVVVPNATGWRPKVDIRGEGGYVIAPPSIHHTGRVYEFIFREGLRGWEELAELDLAEFSLRKPGKGNLNLDLSGVKIPRGSEVFEAVEEGQRNSFLASLLGKCFKAGMSIEQAWLNAETWNNGLKNPLPEKEVQSTFRSILKLHQKSFVIQSVEMPAPVIVEEVGEKTESQEIQEPQLESQEQEPNPDTTLIQPTDTYPIECLQPGGLLQDIMNFVEYSSAKHKPIFALGCAVCIVGNVLAQRVMTETGLRTNMYCVSIGYSGGGKNASHSAISAILGASAARITLGPTDTASGAAVLKWLSVENHNISLVQLDEVGMLLKGLKNPASPLNELPRMLTKIFSEADRKLVKSYADVKLNITIPWHHLSLYASSTPGQFWGNLDEADAASGFLARLLIFEACEKSDMPRTVINSTIPKALLKKIDDLWNIPVQIDPDKGDIARVPMPFVIPKTQEAQDFFRIWETKYFDLQNHANETGEEAHGAIYGRAAEHASKLALIHAMSLTGPKTKEVELESVKWACLVVDSCLQTLFNGLKRSLAGNPFKQTVQRIKDMMKGTGEVAVSKIYRALRMPKRSINEALENLVLSGDVVQEERKPKRGPPSLVLVDSSLRRPGCETENKKN